jgi:hypothetical protein
MQLRGFLTILSIVVRLYKEKRRVPVGDVGSAPYVGTDRPSVATEKLLRAVALPDRPSFHG